MNRKEKSYLTKQRIVKTALNLVSEKSYQEVKVTDICTASGTSIGSFYHYFNSKEDVFLATRDLFDVWLQKRLDTHEYSSNLERLNELINSFFINAEISSLGGIQVQYSLWLTSNGNNSEISDSSSRFFIKTIHDCLINGVEKNEFSLVYSTEDTCEMIICTLRGILINWALENGPFNIMDVGTKQMKNLINLLLKKD